MLPFGVTIPVTVPQGSEIPEGLMNNPVYSHVCVVSVDIIQRTVEKNIKILFNNECKIY
jgi:hypothetical protein